MSFELRPYQKEQFESVRQHFNAGRRRVLAVAPTGSGKTVMVAHAIGAAAAKGKTAWFLNHRREIIRQSSDTFTAVGVTHGVIASGYPYYPGAKIQVASVQTILNKLDELPKPDLIIWDETHHLAAGSWARIFNTYPEAFHLGLTATPERLDGTGLSEFYDVMVEGPSVGWLIEHGWLSPYDLFSPPGVDTSGLHTTRGDFVPKEVNALMSRPSLTGSVIAEYKKHCYGKRAILFAPGIDVSRELVSELQANGIPAAHVDGKTPMEERDRATMAFKRGDLWILSNVELFGEGYDLPAIEAVIGFRPTQSLCLYRQQVGRGLRISEGKSRAVIIDHAGNWKIHGLPDDEVIWKLEGREKKNRGGGEAAANVKVCPKCFGAMFYGVIQCKYCQHIFETKERSGPELRKGDLVKVDKEAARLQRLNAKSYDELVLEAKMRRNPYPEKWAQGVMAKRMEQKPQEAA